MYKKMIDTFYEKQAEIYERDSQAEIWMRSLHENGAIWAFKGSDKDSPVFTFAILTDGTLHSDRHENLIHLFLGKI
jgi:hypothetical protein